MRIRHRIFFRNLDDTSFGNSSIQLPLIYMWFPAETWAQPFLSLICCISVPTGISCLRANSYSFSHKFARITARDAPIAEPSTCTYHESIHVKYILLTAVFKSLFMLLFEFQEETPGCTASVKQFQLPPSVERCYTNFSHQEILWFHPDLEQCFQLFL